MKTPHLRFLSLSCAVLSAFSVISYAADEGTDSNNASGDTSNSKSDTNGKSDTKKPKTIMLLDGSVLFGKVELTDDYTLKISSDSGIQKIALSMLGESDFKKYGFGKDRSKDGRFWSERQDAVNDEKKKEDADGGQAKDNKDNKDNGSQLEISLAEILPFQPLIASFQKDSPSKKDDKSTTGDQKDKSASSGGTELPFVPLFSQPGMSSLPTSPLTGLGSGAGLPSAPGTGLLPTAGIPGLPTTP